MYIVMKSNELQHYGVKGMKWGVRKDRGSSSGGFLKKAFKATHPLTYAAGKAVGKKAKKTASTVSKKTKSAVNSKQFRSAQNKYRNLSGSRSSAAMTKYRSKNIDGMSNKDLQNAITRMNLEKQYRSLTKVDTRKGRKAVNDMSKQLTMSTVTKKRK